jgi:SSS family solute:Na+ symporter
VLFLGGALCIATIIWKLPGGLGQIFSVAIADGRFSAADLVAGKFTPSSWGLSLDQKTVTMMLILGLSNWLFEYGGNQTVIQRYAASQSARDARKAMWFCAFASMAIWATFMFIGTALYVFFKQFPCTETTQILSGELKAERILPFFIVNHLPVGITGLVIAAALSAALSTLNAAINSITMVTVQDIYRAFIVEGRADRHYLIAAYVVSGASALIMVTGALILDRAQTKTLQDTGTIMNSLLGGGFLGVYLLGFLTNRGDARAVWVGLICADVFTVWTIIPKSWLPGALNVPFDLYYTGIMGHLIMLVVGYAVGSLLWRRKRDLTNLTIWKMDATPVT